MSVERWVTAWCYFQAKKYIVMSLMGWVIRYVQVRPLCIYFSCFMPHITGAPDDVDRHPSECRDFIPNQCSWSWQDSYASELVLWLQFQTFKCLQINDFALSPSKALKGERIKMFVCEGKYVCFRYLYNNCLLISQSTQFLEWHTTVSTSVYVRVMLYRYMFRPFCWVIFRRVRYWLQSLNYNELYYIYCQILNLKLQFHNVVSTC
jgi:hypothetical protein